MESSARTSVPRPRLPSLDARAADDLRFIRATMERAVSFTAVPGWGAVAMGAVGLSAAALAARATSDAAWLATWLVAAGVASLIGAADVVHKARASGSSLRARPASGIALALAPVFFSGVCLTAALVSAGRFDLLPGLWLVLYGAGVVGASAFTLRAVRWMGAAFLLVGAATLAAPAGWGNVGLGFGFGAIHVAFGLSIARRRDG